MAWHGPANYARAQELAAEADIACRGGEVDKAAALAAIGQVYATLALAIATALPGQHDDDLWKGIAGYS